MIQPLTFGNRDQVKANAAKLKNAIETLPKGEVKDRLSGEHDLNVEYGPGRGGDFSQSLESQKVIANELNLDLSA